MSWTHIVSFFVGVSWTVLVLMIVAMLRQASQYGEAVTRMHRHQYGDVTTLTGHTGGSQDPF